MENFENVSNKIDENLADDVENDIEQNHGEKDVKPKQKIWLEFTLEMIVTILLTMESYHRSC